MRLLAARSEHAYASPPKIHFVYEVLRLTHQIPINTSSNAIKLCIVPMNMCGIFSQSVVNFDTRALAPAHVCETRAEPTQSKKRFVYVWQTIIHVEMLGSGGGTETPSYCFKFQLS